MKYRSLIFLLAALQAALLAGCSEKNGYKIEGTAPDGAKQIVLSTLVGKNPVPVDTVDVKGATFIMKGTVDSPKMAYLSSDNHTFAQFFITNEDFQVIHRDNSSDFDVEGGTENEFYKSFTEDFSKHKDQAVSYMDSLITCNPNSVSLSYFLFRTLYHELDIDTLEKLANKFSPEVQSYSYITILNQLIKQTRLTEPGCKYLDFESKNLKGEKVSFSSMFDGKSWVLLDFWASWCPYCRKENPELVKLYSIYHDKGLKILSVSLDTDYDKWLQAIEHDGLNWDHVSNLDRWECKAARMYGISGIPGNILISPDGVIEARNLHEEELATTLKNKLDK